MSTRSRSIGSYCFTGLRRAVGQPRLLLLLWLVNLALGLPLAVEMGAVLDRGFGQGEVAGRMVEGFDNAWYAVWEARAEGLAESFGPGILGPAAVLGNLDAWWSGELFERAPVLVVLAALHGLVWLFLLGGVLDRLARPEVAGAPRLFSQGARNFSCLLRLTLLSVPLYWLVYRLGRWLYSVVERSTRDVTEEWTVLLWMLAAAVLVVGLLGVVRWVFDHAKIAAVAAGDRRAVGALSNALRLVARQPLKALGIHLAFGVLFVLLVAFWTVVGPGAGQASWLAILVAFLFGQLYLLARIALRLALLAAAGELQRGMGFGS